MKAKQRKLTCLFEDIGSAIWFNVLPASPHIQHEQKRRRFIDHEFGDLTYSGNVVLQVVEISIQIFHSLFSITSDTNTKKAKWNYMHVPRNNANKGSIT